MWTSRGFVTFYKLFKHNLNRPMCMKTINFSSSKLNHCNVAAVTDSESINIFDKNYIRDEFTNVSPHVLSFVCRNLHHQKNHPLNLLKLRIISYMYGTYLNRRGNPLFSVYDELSPVVTTYQNFDSLLVPPDHPSRKKSDSYFINSNYLLRPHTSAHQNELIKSGLDHFLVIGDVYRRDEIDSKHYPVFHQCEAVRLLSSHELFNNTSDGEHLKIFEKDIRRPEKQECHTLEATKLMENDLKNCLLGLVKRLFGSNIEYKWTDSYFPFTHPSWELEVHHEGEWLEVLGCGIMEQEILNRAGASEKIGWAFGLGLERIAMKLYGIPDIRLFWSKDSGFLSQFDVKNIDTPIKYKPSELTSDIKKDIEIHWKDKINFVYPSSKDEEKFYLLSMFPYPSGNLHMGHVRVYTISDSIARFLRMNGKKVIHPIGWDAFGLPAENAAIEKNIHPFEWTHSNIDIMKKQLKDFNLSFDWDKELSTCDPSYYKWTQYLFLLMYEKGLAYKKKSLVNWDPVDQTVLADEQVDENGISWRSGCKVEKRRLSQWFLSTSAFAKSLYDGLSDPILVEWRDAIKIQKHWIGKPDGFIIHFNVCSDGKVLNDTLIVWTDAPELLYGASFIGISPNNHFNDTEYGSNSDEKENKLKISAVHPLSGDKLPIFVSKNLDHASATDSYLGISSITNEKLSEFISKHAIEAPQVIDNSSQCLINSGEFSGMDRNTAREKILEKLRMHNVRVYPTSRRLRDWLISRQRYWGTPIPIINCAKCKAVPVPLSDLPVTLPQLKEFSGKGFSLSSVTEWVNVLCPKCGGPATRETDTMDTFVDSSWYYLRYLDSQNELEAYNLDKVNANMPVDLYIGGKEHAGLHMFYARFFCHFLHSVNKLKYSEPFIQLLMQGMVMGKSYKVKGSGKYIRKEEVDFSGKYPVEKTTGTPVIEDWEKMSKSKYNGVDPQKVIEEHGIDTTRLFILGNVAPQSPRKWNDELFSGIQNFQWRVWLTLSDFLEQRQTESEIGHPLDEIQLYETKLRDARNYYIKGITHNFINTRQLSVAISKLQGLVGELRRIPKTMAKTNAFEETFGVLIIMLAPMAPHFSSELWVAFCSAAKNRDSHYYDLDKSVLHQKWPQLDENCEMQINIKLNGEDCDVIRMSRPDLLKLSKEETIHMALNNSKAIEALEGIKIKNTHCRQWPNYDSEVNITFVPMGKKAKKAQKLQKAKAVNA